MTAPAETLRSAAASCTRVYMTSAKTAHLVFPDTTPSAAPRALCQIRPYMGRSWFGTGDQAEYEKASALPLCARCKTAAGNTAVTG